MVNKVNIFMEEWYLFNIAFYIIWNHIIFFQFTYDQPTYRFDNWPRYILVKNVMLT